MGSEINKPKDVLLALQIIRIDFFQEHAALNWIKSPFEKTFFIFIFGSISNKKTLLSSDRSESKR